VKLAVGMGALLAYCVYLDLPAYYFDADMRRWRCKPNRSWRVFWKIWRSLENEPRTTDWHLGWRRRLLTAWGLWRVQV
jgi:hypothetical protein